MASDRQSDTSDVLSETRLRQALGARPFRFVSQVGSTNDLACEWALAGALAGSVVVTEEQLSGRGRFGRTWSTPAGTALLMSVILRPRIAPAHIPRLTMIGAVAVADALDQLGLLNVRLKWPNDVLIADRKVAGVLPEPIWENGGLAAVVLGIGLNVRVNFAGSGLEDRAISLEDSLPATQWPVNRADLLDALLRRVEFWMLHLEDQLLLTAWRNRLDTLGRTVTAHGNDDSGVGADITGQAVDVTDEGALILRTDDGTIHHVIAGEVTLATRPG